MGVNVSTVKDLENVMAQLETFRAAFHDAGIMTSQRVSNMRNFAGNDSRILKRVPMVQRAGNLQAATASAVQDALSMAEVLLNQLKEIEG